MQSEARQAMMGDPKPGTIGLVKMGAPAAKWIRLGQILNGDGSEDLEHAFVLLPGGEIIEAEPGGARIVAPHYDDVYWCEGIARLLPAGAPIARTANYLEGVPYSAADYAALVAHRLRIPVPGLRAYVASSGHMICSQLADELYQRLGVHIFRDGRWPGYVTPGMLYQRDQQRRKAGKP
jgi:hypothetical protein